MKQSIEDRMRKENKNNFNIQSLEKGLLFGTKICKKTWTYEIVAVDEMFAKMLGIPASRKEEAIGIEMSDIIHPNDLARVVKETLWELQGSEKYDCKYRMKNADDEYHWVRDIGERFWIDGQEYVQGTVFDIDEKETLIRERDVTYESMPGGVVFVVIGKDNFYIREANQYSFDMLGVGREEYLGSSGKYTFPEDLPKLRKHFVQQAKKREPLDYEFRIRLEKNGKIVWYRIIGNYIDSREQGEEYLCIMMDITTRKTFQYELIKEKEKYERTLNTSADLLFEYNVRHKKFRILGQNYISDDTKLAIEDSLDEDYRKILFKNDIVFRGDRSKIKEEEWFKEYNLLTAKPVIYAANVAEDDLADDGATNEHVAKVRQFAADENSEVFVICAQIEQEIAELDDEEKKMFLEDLGIAESGLEKLIKASYKLLGLISYITSGEMETKAWTITKGTKAPQAAGKIHTDFERGFIRAEVVSYDHLVENNGYNGAKEKGLVRSEGKEYVVQDGDVVLFRFNV